MDVTTGSRLRLQPVTASRAERDSLWSQRRERLNQIDCPGSSSFPFSWRLQQVVLPLR